MARVLYLSTYRKIAYLKKILAELASDDREITDMISKTEDYRNKCMCSMPGDQKKSGDFTFSLEEWNNLRELKDQTIKNGYRHRDHLFRSKSEMLVAQILDSLGLEYKYEPVVIINGLERHPDFAVYCPEAGRYFFIEHLGCMDDPKYRYDNLVKVEMYEKAGIRNGIDIIYNTEFGRGNFTTAAVLGKIIGLLFAQNSSVLL